MGCLSLPLAPSREGYPPERELFLAICCSGAQEAQAYASDLCHSFQDILCMRSLKPSVATSSSRKPPSYASASTLYQTARLADKIVELTLSLCELHPLLHLEHNPINQAVLKETSRVLLATITFIGKDTNALRQLSLLYQLGQYTVSAQLAGVVITLSTNPCPSVSTCFLYP